MRTRDQRLRRKYRYAAFALIRAEEDVTVKSMTEKLRLPANAVRSYMRRNRDLFELLRLKVQHKHAIKEYQNAIESFSGTRRMSHTHLARKLGIDPSSAWKFLQAHPELKALFLQKQPKRQKT